MFGRNDDHEDIPQAPEPPPIPPYRTFKIRRYVNGELVELIATAHNMHYQGDTLETVDIVEFVLTNEGWRPSIKVRQAWNGWDSYEEVPTPQTSSLVLG